jgi:hypothetical protein
MGGDAVVASDKPATENFLLKAEELGPSNQCHPEFSKHGAR